MLSFLNAVEQAYESKIDAAELLERYKAFKQVVPGKAQEKKIGREFEAASGYSLYRAVQTAKQTEKGPIRLA